jgi:hypothetical protein
MKINHKGKLLLVTALAVLSIGGASVGAVHALSANNSTAVSDNQDTDKETNDDSNKSGENTEDNGKDGEVQDDQNR